MTGTAGDSVTHASNLQQAVDSKSAMLSKGDIQQKDKEWTQKYGYKATENQVKKDKRCIGRSCVVALMVLT